MNLYRITKKFANKVILSDKVAFRQVVKYVDTSKHSDVQVSIKKNSDRVLKSVCVPCVVVQWPIYAIEDIDVEDVTNDVFRLMKPTTVGSIGTKRSS